MHHSSPKASKFVCTKCDGPIRTLFLKPVNLHRGSGRVGPETSFLNWGEKCPIRPGFHSFCLAETR